MKCFVSRSLGILAIAALIASGGCSDQPVSPQGKPSGQKSGDAKNSAVKPLDSTKPADAKPVENKSAGAKPSDTNPAATNPAPSTPPANEKKMSVNKEAYGKLPDGTEVDLYSMTNSNGMKVQIMTYGATITGVEVPDKAGKIANVALHHGIPNLLYCKLSAY